MSAQDQVRLLHTRVVVRNGSLDQPPATRPDLRPDAIHIEPVDGALELTVYPYRQMQADPQLAPETVVLPCSREEARVAVAECLASWQSVVDYERRFLDGTVERPFQEACDLRNRPELLRELGPGLAIAGRNLFETLFGPAGAHREIKQLIRSVAGSANAFTIRSNHLFVPWPLLYSPPDGSLLGPTGANWLPEGFWGVRHVLDHRIKEHDHYRDVLSRAEQLRVSLNYDPTIDSARGHPVVGNVRAFLMNHAPPLSIPERTSRDAVLDALASGDFSEQIAYFCCHQKDQQPTAIVLDNMNEPITTATLRNAAQTGYPGGFDKALLVFFNTCQGGRISEHLVGDFAPAWLRLDANCVLGAQVDVPAMFAQVYAERFFSRILGANARFGEVVRDLSREFMVDMCNPLGLIYCLYRGSTARVVRPDEDGSAAVHGADRPQARS